MLLAFNSWPAFAHLLLNLRTYRLNLHTYRLKFIKEISSGIYYIAPKKEVLKQLPGRMDKNLFLPMMPAQAEMYILRELNDRMEAGIYIFRRERQRGHKGAKGAI
jgi:hypothetical protein